MGQAKLKRLAGDVPTVRKGPHGDDYYCRKGCGKIAYTKGHKQYFKEYNGQPEWGWCHGCKADAQALRFLAVMQEWCATSATREEALLKAAKGAPDNGQVYNLSAPLQTLPAFLALPHEEVNRREILLTPTAIQPPQANSPVAAQRAEPPA